MATTDSTPSYAIDFEGGFPTEDELAAVWSALADVGEFAITPVMDRVSRGLAENYESEDSSARLDWTYEQLGRFSARTDSIVRQCEYLLEDAKKLETLRAAIGEVIVNEGRVDVAPPFSGLGGPYQPSRKALERWGLAGVVANEDTSRIGV